MFWRSVSRAVLTAIKIESAIAGILFVAFLLVWRIDLMLWLIRIELVAITIPIAIWLAGTVLTWDFTRKQAAFAIRDTSSNPAPLPADLVTQEAELLRLGFRPAGQYEIDSAWPEKAPRIYAFFTFPSNPSIDATLSFTTKWTCLATFWADGRVLESTFPRPEELKALDGVPTDEPLLPPWLIAQYTDSGVEALYELHLAAMNSTLPAAGAPVPAPDIATAIALEVETAPRVHAYYSGSVDRFVRQQATLGAILIPAWLALLWFAFSVQPPA
jgi:hypothetical protein